MYSRQKKEMNCLNSLIEEEVTEKCNGRLQHKVWKPGKLRSGMKCDGSKGNRELQHKVWKPGGWTLGAYDLEVIIFLPWESNAGAS